MRNNYVMGQMEGIKMARNMEKTRLEGVIQALVSYYNYKYSDDQKQYDGLVGSYKPQVKERRDKDGCWHVNCSVTIPQEVFVDMQLEFKKSKVNMYYDAFRKEITIRKA